MYRKKRILSIPDHTCHLARRSIEFLAIRLFIFVPSSVVSFWLRETSDLTTITYTYQIAFLLDNAAVRPIKMYSSSEHHLSVPNEPPQKNARRLSRNGQPRRRLQHSPGSNIRICLNFENRREGIRVVVVVVVFSH